MPSDDILRDVIAAEDPDLPQVEMAQELLDLRAEVAELRDALTQLYGVAYHRQGCGKGIPADGKGPMAETCPCGVRQALDRARRMKLPPEERVAKALMGEE